MGWLHKVQINVDTDRPLDIAVVGSGISGLGCAWLLSERHRVTLYESDARLGGHTNTFDVSGPMGTLPVDTGFIVFNAATYPNLVALLAHIGVETRTSDMSFAVSLDDGRLEYSGTDLNGLFAQRRNLFRPRFLAMLRDLLRFYRDAPKQIADLEGLSLGAFLERGKYGRAFRDDHLLPMAAAIWSAPSRTLLDFPAATFVRFCENHGLLKIANRPAWRTICGGSRTYIDHLIQPLGDRIRRERPIVAVERSPGGVTLRDASGTTICHDHVVLATHADQSLNLLAEPSAAERRILGALRYGFNHAVLHTDASLMPRRRNVWSSWNYLGRRDGAGADQLCVTYWMNCLQGLTDPTDYFVTLNPPSRPKGVLYETNYEHPVFDVAALAAQKEMWSLQGEGRVWFCGAYCGAGFHEDGLQAGLAVAEALGGVRRPWTVPHESGRIFLGPPTAQPQTARIAA